MCRKACFLWHRNSPAHRPFLKRQCLPLSEKAVWWHHQGTVCRSSPRHHIYGCTDRWSFCACVGVQHLGFVPASQSGRSLSGPNMLSQNIWTMGFSPLSAARPCHQTSHRSQFILYIPVLYWTIIIITQIVIIWTFDKSLCSFIRIVQIPSINPGRCYIYIFLFYRAINMPHTFISILS